MTGKIVEMKKKQIEMFLKITFLTIFAAPIESIRKKNNHEFSQYRKFIYFIYQKCTR